MGKMVSVDPISPVFIFHYNFACICEKFCLYGHGPPICSLHLDLLQFEEEQLMHFQAHLYLPKASKKLYIDVKTPL